MGTLDCIKKSKLQIDTQIVKLSQCYSNMTLDISWDVEKYFSPTEPKHHWELRRKFMEENKGRYKEHRIACLAQTLINIEILGCRYPKPVMELIEELSHGIVQPFR